MATAKLKILVLHGHSMSASLMKAKMGAIKTETKKLVDWHFVDGPILLKAEERVTYDDPPPPISSPPGSGTPSPTTPSDEGSPTLSTSSSSPTVSSPTGSSAAEQRSWYSFDRTNALSLDGENPITLDENGREQPLYDGIDEALLTIEQYCADNGPFDGLFAFSQGTILATLIAAQLRVGKLLFMRKEKGEEELAELFLRRLPTTQSIFKGESPLCNLRFASLASGLLPRDPFYRSLILGVPPPTIGGNSSSSGGSGNDDITCFLPTLHCYGVADQIITPKQSVELMNAAVYQQQQQQNEADEGGDASEVAGEASDDATDKQQSQSPPQPQPPIEATHTGGHVVASSLRKPIKAFLQGYCIPAAAAASSSASRTAGKGGKPTTKAAKKKSTE